MNKDFLSAYKQKLINDEPIEIVAGLKIYPALIRDYIIYCTCSQVLQIDKNSVNDPKIISMSYLEFLVYLIEKDSDAGIFGTAIMLDTLMKLVTNNQDCEVGYGKDDKGKLYLSVGGIVLYKKDFDKVRKAILYQNSPDYNDEYINPELKSEIDKANAIRNKGNKPKDIEYQIMAVVLGTSMTYEQVLNMTIRRFYIAMEMIESKMAYQMKMQASLSGFIKIKEGIPHYLSESNNGLESSVVDYAQFKDKISNA